jgi:hypothetical protein
MYNEFRWRSSRTPGMVYRLNNPGAWEMWSCRSYVRSTIKLGLQQRSGPSGLRMPS